MANNPNFKSESTMDFFNFMKDFYSEQSTEKALKSIDKRLGSSENTVEGIQSDVDQVKKDVKIIKDSIDGISSNQGGILDLLRKSPIAPPGGGPRVPAGPTTSTAPPSSTATRAGGAAAGGAGASTATTGATAARSTAARTVARGGTAGAVAGLAVTAGSVAYDYFYGTNTTPESPQPQTSLVPTPSPSPIAAPSAPQQPSTGASSSSPSRPSGQITITPERQSTPLNTPASVPQAQQGVQQNLQRMVSALAEQGITDPKIVTATLANVMKETSGYNVSENMNYARSDNERIRKIFGQRAARFTDAELDEIKKDPYKMGELMYGSNTAIGRKMGNLEEGEGYKYRGRGFVQLTGKNNYARASQALFGDDRLVQNPDLLNDPNIAARASSWYMKDTQASTAKMLGLDVNKLTPSQAQDLTTSQIAGLDVTTSQSEYIQELRKKVGAYYNDPSVKSAVAASAQQQQRYSMFSLDTDSLMALPTPDGTDQPLERPGSPRYSNAASRREPTFNRQELGTGRRENIVSIGQTDRVVDPNRQNLLGQRLNEPRFEIPYDETRQKQSAQVFDYEEFKRKREDKLKIQTRESLTAFEESKPTSKLTADRESRAPVSGQDNSTNQAVLKTILKYAGRGAVGLSLAEALSEVGTAVTDKSDSATVIASMRQQGDYRPGGATYSPTPDEMTDFYSKKMAELTRTAVNESVDQGRLNSQQVNQSLQSLSSYDQGPSTIVMQPIVMPEKVIERNTPVPAQGSDPGVPPVSPPPSSVDSFMFGLSQM